jgi:4'-phosphopantetheinyl transferase
MQPCIVARAEIEPGPPGSMDESQSRRDDHGLPPGEIHLWHAFCDAPAESADYLLLSDDERQAERKFHFAADRRRYRITRAMVRATLSLYLGIDPRDCRFERDPHGRPVLINAQAPGDELSFNVSHSHHLIVLGVSRNTRLGVDVEKLDARRASLGLADRFFAPTESAHLRRLPARARAEVFFRYWTLKEAYVKARGLGLAIPLNRFSFDLAGPGVGFHVDSELNDCASRWSFMPLRAPPGYVGAICVERMHKVDVTVLHRHFRLPGADS